MLVLIAPDKFKGSLSAREVCDAVARGLKNIQHIKQPMADGGEGTFELLLDHFKGHRIECKVHDPLMRSISASYGISEDGKIAFIEMASASGLQLLKPEEKNPLLANTFGTGELICNAIKRNVKRIVIGIGGSATNDAGIGMASALGYSFLDGNGSVLIPNGENLSRIKSIDTPKVKPGLKEISFTTLCDVENPLHGKNGAAWVYAKQKGADEDQVRLLDDGLVNFKSVAEPSFNTSLDFPGAGAAGGLGAGCKVFLNSEIKKGADFLIDILNIEQLIRDCDVLITGEGKVDEQTLSGKVVQKLCNAAKRYGKKTIVVCGHSEISHDALAANGIDTLIALTDGNTPVQTAIREAASLLEKRISDHFSSVT